MLDLLTLEYLVDSNACVVGTPEQCLEACRAYEAAGVDLLALPREPIQDLPRGRHADDRAHGHRGDPALHRLMRGRAPTAGRMRRWADRLERAGQDDPGPHGVLSRLLGRSYPGPPRRPPSAARRPTWKHRYRWPPAPPDIVLIRAFELTRRAVWVHPCRGTGQCMRAGPDKSLQEHQLARDRLNEDGWYGHRSVIIVPAFNEDDLVGRVVVHRAGAPVGGHPRFNDGSRDATAAVAETAGATVLSLPVNLGIGGAVQAGYRYAHRYGFDFALQIDGDGQHDPRETTPRVGPDTRRRGGPGGGFSLAWARRLRGTKARRFGMRILSMLLDTCTCLTDRRIRRRASAVGRRGIALFAGNIQRTTQKSRPSS